MKLVLGILAAYAGIVALAYLVQTHLLFPAHFVSAGNSGLPDSATHIELNAPDDIRLAGIRIAPATDSDRNNPVLIGFGGNAWDARNAAIYLHGLFPENEVFVFHYRGYGDSAGRPAAADLLSDSLQVYDYVEEKIGPGKIVAVGFSIGSGVAAHLASKRAIAGLILVTPFDSLRALASHHYPWLPVKWLFRHDMEVAADIADLTVPTALIAAEHDTIVPARRTHLLRQAIQNPVLDRTIKGAGHNDLYDRTAFRTAMSEALEQIEQAAEHR